MTSNANPALELGPKQKLGKKLRDRRKGLGMTLQAVADASGLTAGFISQIERDITAPSISSLVSVANTLGVPVRDLLSQPENTEPLTRQATRPVYSIPDGDLQYERLSTNFSGSVIRSVIVHEPPGHKTEPNSHDGEELLLILSGEITADVGGKISVLKTGDSLHFCSSIVHAIWNHSTEAASILWAGTMDVFGDDEAPNPMHKNK